MFHFIFDINITDRPALYRATIFWLFTIPMYWVSLTFLWIFYEYGHAWKKNGVVVGYEYIDNTNEPWEEKFKGHWVSHTNDKELIGNFF